MSLYPKTLRFVLSGQSDKSLILQCLKSAHQLLGKPCNPELLTSTLSKALNSCSSENEVVLDLVSKIEILPKIQTVYSDIMETMWNPSASIEEVGDMISRDISLTSSLLKMANSSFFGLGRNMTSVVEATSHLGLDSVRSLVLIIGNFTPSDTEHSCDDVIQTIWRHSYQTAVKAKNLCLFETKNKKLAQECFVAGMLHDIGKLGLAFHLKPQYIESLEYSSTERVMSYIAEQKVFGTDHAEVGFAMLARWGLPQTLLDAVAFHHSPNRSGTTDVSPLTFLHIANALIHQESENEKVLYLNEIDTNYLESLGLQSKLDQWKSISDGR